MKSLVNIPKGLTHGEDLIVMRRIDYDNMQRQIEEFKDALGKIKRGEKELQNGKTRIVNSLSELR